MEEGEIAIKILVFLATEYPGEFDAIIVRDSKKISQITQIPSENIKEFINGLLTKAEEQRKKEEKKRFEELISSVSFCPY